MQQGLNTPSQPVTVTLAGVAADKTVYGFDKIFDYIVPPTVDTGNLCGRRVLVPFGRGNKKKQAMVMYTKQATVDAKKYKRLLSVLDEKPVLTDEMLGLARFMKSRCYCTLYDCIRAMLPVGINYKINALYTVNPQYEGDVAPLDEAQQQIYNYLRSAKKPVAEDKLLKDMGLLDNSVLLLMNAEGVLSRQEEALRELCDKSQKMIRLTGDNADAKLTPRQAEAYEVLNVAFSLSVKELCYYVGCTRTVADALVKKGVAEYFEQEVFRNPDINKGSGKGGKELELTIQQKIAYDDLLLKYRSGKAQVSLLYGVTGSGKTSVFMKLIDSVIKDNKGVIVMVPEIALTSQLINLFIGRYGQNVAVFHSGLSVGERLDQWKRVRNGSAKIAVGTRSAVFAPFDDIGLIIMDEEQEYTYKSEAAPRFHARDVAKYRCSKHSCL